MYVRQILIVILTVFGISPVFAQAHEPSTESSPLVERLEPVSARSEDIFTFKIGSIVYRLNREIPDFASAEFFSLNETQKITFFEKRYNLLKNFARVLSWNRLGIGYGVLIRDTIVQKYNSHLEKQNPIQLFLSSPPRDSDGRTHAVSLSPTAAGDEGVSVISSMLMSIDKILWSKPKLIAGFNEVSFMLNFSSVFGVAVEPIGISLGSSLGLNIGYNFKENALFFEVFTEAETMKKVHSKVIFMSSIGGRAAVELAAQDYTKFEAYREGTSINPPLVFTGIATDGNLALGIVATKMLLPGDLKIPGSDLFLAYSGNVARLSILRVVARKPAAGIFHVYGAGLKEYWALARFIGASGPRLVKSFRTFKEERQRRTHDRASCSSIFGL